MTNQVAEQFFDHAVATHRPQHSRRTADAGPTYLPLS